MKKTELMKLLKTLVSRDMKNDPDGFIDKLKKEGLDKIDIKNNLVAKEGLDKIIKVLSLEDFFKEIEIEDEDNKPLQENIMDIWVNNLRRVL